MAEHSIVDFTTLLNSKFARKSTVTDLTDVFENVAPFETSPATAAHAVGDQLIYNKILYTVTTAISIGDALAVGVNISTSDDIVEQISGKEDAPVVLTSTLAAGATTLTFTNAAISASALIDVYTDTFGVNPSNQSVSGTTLTLTFKAQAAAVVVKVLVR